MLILYLIFQFQKPYCDLYWVFKRTEKWITNESWKNGWNLFQCFSRWRYPPYLFTGQVSIIFAILGCAALLLAQPHHHIIFVFLFLLFSTFCLLFHCCWCCWCCCCHCWCCAVAEQVAEQFNCKFCHSLRSLWDWKSFQSCFVCFSSVYSIFVCYI